MKSEQAIRNRIKREEILIESTIKKAISHPIHEDREDKIGSALREHRSISERIWALKWVLGEIVEL